MPTRIVPRLMISSRREPWVCACAELAVRRRAVTKHVRIRNIVFSGENYAGDCTRYRAAAGIRKRAPGRLCVVTISRRAAADHFAPDLLEAAMRIALALIDQLDRGLRAHRAADGHRHRAFADALVDEIFVMLAAADAPFEADRGHWARANFGVAIGFGGRDGR